MLELADLDISTSDIDALKAQYDTYDEATYNDITAYIDNLKSAYDLENKKLTSFVEEVDSIETILAATADVADFDLTDSLVGLRKCPRLLSCLNQKTVQLIWRLLQT